MSDKMRIKADLEIFKELSIDTNGSWHSFDECGVVLEVPEGAVREEMIVHLTIGLVIGARADKAIGEFKFEDDKYTPVTPIVMVTTEKWKLRKPLKLHLHHFIDTSVKSNQEQKMAIFKADCTKCTFRMINTDVQNDSKTVTVLLDNKGPNTSFFCAALKSIASFPKRIVVMLAEKRVNDGVLLIDICFLYDQPYLQRLVKKQFESQQYQVTKKEVFSLLVGQKISLEFFPEFKGGQQGWRMKFTSAYHAFISGEDLDHYKIWKEEGVEKLAELIDCKYFPSHYCLKLKKIDQNADEKTTWANIITGAAGPILAKVEIDLDGTY